jgi:hypothetical protein
MNNEAAILFYLFIGIFSITAVITLLGILGILKNIKEKYLNALFGAVILEVVAVVIISYKQLDFKCETDAVINKFLVGITTTELSKQEEKIDFLLNYLTESKKIKSDYDTLLKKYSAISEGKSLQLNKPGKEYLSKIIRLREITRNEMDGTSINLVFNTEKKAEVFRLLKEIFTTLGKLDPSKDLTNNYITDTYISFLKNYRINDKLISTNTEGIFTGVYVTDYTTSLMLRAYLEKFYPVK